MLSDSVIPQMQWHVQGHIFAYDVRVLPLKCYDMVLGADWLEHHSPMLIHWRKRHIRFTHNDRRILLRRVTDEPRKCSQGSTHKLKGMLKKKAITHLLELKANCPLEQQFSGSLSVMNISNQLVQSSDTFVEDNRNHPEVQQLLEKYQYLFSEPTELPPKRDYDHHCQGFNFTKKTQPLELWS